MDVIYKLIYALYDLLHIINNKYIYQLIKNSVIFIYMIKLMQTFKQILSNSNKHIFQYFMVEN